MIEGGVQVGRFGASGGFSTPSEGLFGVAVAVTWDWEEIGLRAVFGPFIVNLVYKR